MSEFFWDTMTEEMKLVLNGFSRSKIGQQFYLAGGTALALQLGHRRSFDLDFFSPTEDIPTIRPRLEEALASFDATLADSSWGNLVYLVKDVRIGFYGYGYELIGPLIEKEGLRLASLEDIALMKLDTLLSRAARKDFYDLYFICQRLPLKGLLNLTPQKYPSVRDFETQVVKGIFHPAGERDWTRLAVVKIYDSSSVQRWYKADRSSRNCCKRSTAWVMTAPSC